jgi:hypothetical protein
VIEKLKLSSFLLLCLCVVACKEKNTENTNREEKHSIRISMPTLPKSMFFFDQEINLEDEDIRERLDREVVTNVYFQSATTLALKRANRFFPEIERILLKEKVPDDFKYLAVIESNLSEVVSAVGANGYGQFMPYTDKEYGLIINNEVDERLNLLKNFTTLIFQK